MSTPETDFDLDLHFLPAWAQKPAAQNQYAEYKGGHDRPDSREQQRRDRPPRRRDQPQGRGPRPDRPRGPGPGEPRRFQQPRGRSGRHGGRDRGPQRDRQGPPPAPLPEIHCAFVPDDRGVESLAWQIKMTGRAYPLFEIAQMILQKPERHSVVFGVRKNAEGRPLQALFVCALDDTLWLSEDEAVA